MSDTNLLAPCPDSPNCVSSLATDEDREFDVVGQSRIQARFSSRLLRFVDDVTFYVREDGMVEVRSASRVGYWDLGANRRRVESLREQLAEQAPDDSTSQHYPQHGSRSLG